MVETTTLTPSSAGADSPTAVQSVLSEHEIPTRSGEPGGLRVTQVRPPSVVATTDPSSASTQQREGPTQEIIARKFVVIGKESSLFQRRPAFVVRTTAPSTPTAKQSEVVGHETPPTLPVRFGSFSTVHVVPLSVVMTATEAVAVPPTATQSDVVGQETLPRTSTASGTLSAVHVRPPLVVAITPAPGPVSLLPTATQSNAVGQEIPFKFPIPVGVLCATHRWPASVVATRSTLPPPAAKQTDVVGQVIVLRSFPFPGRVCCRQLCPAVVLWTTVESSPPPRPRTKQSELVGHEMARGVITVGYDFWTDHRPATGPRSGGGTAGALAVPRTTAARVVTAAIGMRM
jgi:hypothetical protein